MLDKARTPAATLTRARSIAIRNGLRFVYTGNVHDSAGASTYCPGCNARVIERDWYEIGAWDLDANGRCLKCSTQIPGVFSGAAGTWGARRMAVRIADALA
jgi:pyruvate formate lyase activating enzyme